MKMRWHLSRYNLISRIPEENRFVAVNLFSGAMAEFSEPVTYLLSVAEELHDDHPVLEYFKRLGMIVDFDEQEALESMGKCACSKPGSISLTIAPTMACNFDCPYCYEDNRPGKMEYFVQNEVISFVEKLIRYFSPETVRITWYGGEPLMASDVVESLSMRLIDLAESNNIFYLASMVSNGYLLTEENVALMERCRISQLQTTLDGLGNDHDVTRHLAGGGKTFERIVSNLRDRRLPFEVRIRHNVHSANYDQIEPLKHFVEELAEKSGNRISYYSGIVHESAVAVDRGRMTRVVEEKERLCRLDLSRNIEEYFGRSGLYCGSQILSHIGIDEAGRLYKCWEDMDKPALSYGNVWTWDVKRPIVSAENADNLTMYLNTAGPVPDEECRDCIWLPVCRGGCPRARLNKKRSCVRFKDDKDAFVMAYYASEKAKAKLQVFH